jgi:hypothetical protein
LALAAEIRVEVDGTPGSNDMPGRILLRTTPDGSQAPVDAVKIDSAQNVTVSAGNLVIGTSGKGIDFSATPGAGTSELLADYEEGTWTPVQGAGLSVVGTFSSSGRYTKIGRMVYLSGRVAGSTSVATTAGTIMMTGLPFTVFESTTTGTMTNGSINTFGGIGAFTTTAYSTSTFVADVAIDFNISYSV